MILSFLFSLLLSKSFAAPIIVEEVKDRKATVYVPVGIELKPGDQLNPSIQVPNPVPAIVETPLPQMRKREHILIGSFSGGTSKLKMKAPINTITTVQSSELEVQYGYNFGRWMPWVGAAHEGSKSGSVESKANVFSVGAALNFIENVPGNNLIPFVSLSAGGYMQDISDSTTTMDVAGTLGQASLGLIWFPFGELSALVFSIKSSAVRLTVTGGTAESADGNLSRSSSAIGYAMAF